MGRKRQDHFLNEVTAAVASLSDLAPLSSPTNDQHSPGSCDSRRAADEQVELLRAVFVHVRSIDEKLSLPSLGPDGWMTIAQAAQVAGVSEKTIRRAIKAEDAKRKLTSFDISNSGRPLYRISRSDLDVWMRENLGGTESTPRPPVFRPSSGDKDYFPDL